jgi:hypothetical protein
MTPDIQIVVSQQEPNCKKQDLEELLHCIEQLSSSDQIALMQRLSGSNNSGLNIAPGNRQLLESILMQINTLNREQLGEILSAIANRITDAK